MALADFEKTLLLLYTNESELSAFLMNREEWLEKRNLTEHEQKTLVNLQELELRRFVDSLQAKRLRVARSMLSSASGENSIVVLLSTYRFGPALIFRTSSGEEEVTITPGMYQLLFFCEKNSVPLSFKGIIQSYQEFVNQGTNPATLLDALSIAKIMQQYHLTRHTLRSPL